jgi:hypothetical protein
MAVASAFAEAFEKSVANRIRRIRVTIDQPFSVCDARDRRPGTRPRPPNRQGSALGGRAELAKRRTVSQWIPLSQVGGQTGASSNQMLAWLKQLDRIRTGKPAER